MTTVHARSEWTSRTFPVTLPRRGVGIGVLHHEGGGVRGNPADKPAALRQIEGYVLPKGYVAIDYNLMVFQDGSIWEGRGLGREDAATLHLNAESVSVCAVGNFDREQPTPQLIAGIAEAFRYARDTGWLAAGARLQGHRDSFSTACPGALLYPRLGDIRAAFAGAPVPIPPAPAPPPAPPLPDPEDPAVFFFAPDNTFHYVYVNGAGDLCQAWPGGHENLTKRYGKGAIGPLDPARPVQCEVQPNTFGAVVEVWALGERQPDGSVWPVRAHFDGHTWSMTAYDPATAVTH